MEYCSDVDTLRALNNDQRSQLSLQISQISDAYPGGIGNYVNKAKKLLRDVVNEVNPFEGFTPTLPSGVPLPYSSSSYTRYESLGLNLASSTGFVLVAGGLGERLGYGGIKLQLTPYLVSGKCYLETYTDFLKGIADRSGGNVPPLVIMTSGDTDELTRKLLEDNDYYGLRDSIEVIMQDKVPAIVDVEGRISLKKKSDGGVEIETKPHGHGDVHHLLHRSGIAASWDSRGLTNVVFLQDTNALVINGLLPALGVGEDEGFDMTSICVPRMPGEAAGAIVDLQNSADPSKSIVINVEYNQLDPLLNAQGLRDEPDEVTGYSAYPGNANNLVFKLKTYRKTIEGEDQGVVNEFVNPKFKEDKVTFKKATRLECMMQDFPLLMRKEIEGGGRVGFAQFDREMTFSPAKNSRDSGIEGEAKGSKSTGTLTSAESEGYLSNVRKLMEAGNIVEGEGKGTVKLGDITVMDGPRCMLGPRFCLTKAEVGEKFKGSKISKRSTLYVSGSGVKITGLDLDGALTVDCCEGATLDVNGLKVCNDGWVFRDIKEGEEVNEEGRIRGYVLEKVKTMEIKIKEKGNWRVGEDGVVTRV
ncbi:hypothetical protein TrCOL_g13895 [Triparma columacea]|uniref:UTP-monosaccharide-1-phosphate uridylyltransferase n=1 Tax=Triparma columacea TaxID=722753 RepID=A0A9W7LCD8_9STRA|nr:hypothetical protein TrCOL_g13895 [Triparma columacea]